MTAPTASAPRDAAAPDARRPRVFALAAVAALCVVQSVLAYGWMARNGFLERPFTSDAAWYRIDALRMKQAFDADGVGGWLQAAFDHDRPHPPFVVMAVGLLAALRGDDGVSHQAAFFVIQAFGALFVFGTYRLARRFLGRFAAVGAAAAAASFPVVIPNLRPLYPQFPMAAVLVWTSVAVLRTEGFTGRGKSVVFGAVAGAATMVKMLAPLYFVGSAAAALAYGLLRPGARRRVLANVGCGLAAAAVVVLPWYSRHWESVRRYMNEVTGDEGQQIFSASLPTGSIARWVYYPFHFFNDGIGWLFAVPFFAASVWGVAAAARGLRRRPAADAAATPRLRDGMILTAGPAAAFIPLTLGQTAAESFYLLPFAPLAAVLLVRFAAARRSRASRVAVAVWIGAVALLFQAMGQRPPETFGAAPALFTSSETLVLLTPLEDRRACLPAAPWWRVTGDPAQDRHFLIEVFPKIDRYFGSFLWLVRGVGGRPGETWPVAEFVEEIFKDPAVIRPRVTQTTPYWLTHPYLGHPQIDYESTRLGKSLQFVKREEIMKSGGDPFALLANLNFVVVDERPLPDLVSVDGVLEGLARWDAEGRVVLRASPTAFSKFSLIAIQRKGAASGPRPASDLEAPGALRASVAFANGWRLVGVRVIVGRSGSPLLVAWFDGLAPGDAQVRVSASLSTDGKSLGSSGAVLPLPTACDADRPLWAVTLPGLPTPPEGGAPVLSLRLSSAREDAYKNLALVGETTLPRSGRAAVVVPWDTGAAATRPASQPATRPGSRPASRKR